jgi:hypothetical protein
MKHSHNYTLYVYIIAPIVLLITFIVYFNQFQAQERAKEAEQAAIAQQQKAQKDQEQADLEKRLDAEARKVAKAKADAIAAKEEADTKERRAKIDTLAKQNEAVQKDIAKLDAENAKKTAEYNADHDLRVKAEVEWMNKAKEMERERAVKAATDIEAERLIGIVMDRFDEEWCKTLTTPPPPPQLDK